MFYRFNIQKASPCCVLFWKCGDNEGSKYFFFFKKNWIYVKTLILRTVDGSKNETNVAVSNSTLEKTNLTSLPNDDPNPDKNDLIKINTEEIPTTLEIANQTSLANDDQNQDEITTDSNY